MSAPNKRAILGRLKNMRISLVIITSYMVIFPNDFNKDETEMMAQCSDILEKLHKRCLDSICNVEEDR